MPTNTLTAIILFAATYLGLLIFSSYRAFIALGSAAVISAFVDNVATVLMVAPVAIGIAKKLKMSPVSSIIAIAISSNLEGAATLVGDTTSILLGGYANMNFMDFFFMDGKMGMFWIVQIAAVAATFRARSASGS